MGAGGVAGPAARLAPLELRLPPLALLPPVAAARAALAESAPPERRPAAPPLAPREAVALAGALPAPAARRSSWTLLAGPRPAPPPRGPRRPPAGRRGRLSGRRGGGGRGGAGLEEPLELLEAEAAGAEEARRIAAALRVRPAEGADDSCAGLVYRFLAMAAAPAAFPAPPPRPARASGRQLAEEEEAEAEGEAGTPAPSPRPSLQEQPPPDSDEASPVPPWPPRTPPRPHGGHLPGPRRGFPAAVPAGELAGRPAAAAVAHPQRPRAQRPHTVPPRPRPAPAPSPAPPLLPPPRAPAAQPPAPPAAASPPREAAPVRWSELRAPDSRASDGAQATLDEFMRARRAAGPGPAPPPPAPAPPRPPRDADAGAGPAAGRRGRRGCWRCRREWCRCGARRRGGGGAGRDALLVLPATLPLGGLRALALLALSALRFDPPPRPPPPAPAPKAGA
eukprot:tig00000383_g24690.t1